MNLLTIPRSIALAVALLLLGSTLALASWYERSCQRELLRLEAEWHAAHKSAETGQDRYDHVIYASLAAPTHGKGEHAAR